MNFIFPAGIPVTRHAAALRRSHVMFLGNAGGGDLFSLAEKVPLHLQLFLSNKEDQEKVITFFFLFAYLVLWENLVLPYLQARHIFPLREVDEKRIQEENMRSDPFLTPLTCDRLPLGEIRKEKRFYVGSTEYTHQFIIHSDCDHGQKHCSQFTHLYKKPMQVLKYPKV